MTSAIIAGLCCGALWGFSFLAPRLFTEPASSFAFARYFLGALTALVYLAFHFKSSKKFIKSNPQIVVRALVLSFIGYTLFYWCLVTSVKLIGVSYPSLIVGLLPVTIALFGREGKKFSTQAWVALGLIFCGIICINLDAFVVPTVTTIPLKQKALGFLLATCSLVLWTVFAVQNSKALKKNSEVSGALWACFLSLGAATTMGGLAFWSDAPAATQVLKSFFTGQIKTAFWFWAMVTGVFGSWFASWVWNYASRRLPTSLTGQLIVSETVFALIYGFIYEKRLPHGLEAGAILLLVSGVSLAIKTFKI